MTVLVAQHLDLHVAGPIDESLDIHAGIVERVRRLVASHRELLLELLGLAAHPHALPAPTRCRLDDHGKPDARRLVPGRLHVVDRSLGAGHDRNARGDHGPTGLGLVSHRANHVGGGTDERETGAIADLGELGVLRQEAVAGMDRGRSRDLRRRDDPGDVEIALAAGRRPDTDVLVGESDVQRVAIPFRVDGDGADPQLATGADHAERDLAPVCDQDLIEHLGASPGSIGCDAE